MQQVFIRECTRQDPDSIFQLDHLWDEEEGVAYVFTYGNREEFIADFERFQKYSSWPRVTVRSSAISTGLFGSTPKVEVLPKQETYLEIENIYWRFTVGG